MQKIKLYSLFFILYSFCSPAFAAANLMGSASVNVTSDTAATAKNMALKEARRQIVSEVLMKYTYGSDFKELMSGTDDSTLANLILSTGIDSERLSATTYSANIKMTLDEVAAKKWLTENEIQNWLGSDDSGTDKAVVVIELSNGLGDLIELKRALRAGGVNMDIKRISVHQLTVAVPANMLRQLKTSVSSIGWQTYGEDGYLKIWK